MENRDHREKQRMAVQAAGASSVRPLAWSQIDWAKMMKRITRLQLRIAKAVKQYSRATRHYQVLEPCAVKVAHTVLRGKGAARPLTYPEHPGITRC